MHSRPNEMLSIRAIQSYRRSRLPRYYYLLRRFGIEYSEIPEAELASFEPVLKDLNELFELFPHTKTEMLIDWADVFCAENGANVNHILSKHLRRINQNADNLDKVCAYSYVALNMLSLALYMAGIDGLSTDPATNVTDSSWNYIDSLGGIATAAQQFAQGQHNLGLLTLASSLELTGATLTANIAKYTTATVLGNSLMGFSFAASMFVNSGVEWCKAAQCTQKINKLEIERNNPMNKPALIQKTILVEKAKRANHIRSAKAYAACGVAMTAVATVSYVALSGLTCGALPALTLAIGVIACVSGFARKEWVKHKDHVENLKKTLKDKNEGTPTLLERLNNLVKTSPYEFNFTKNVTLTSACFYKQTLSFRSYLEDLFVKDPKKLGLILTLFEEGHSKEILLKKLKEATSTGSKILNLLEPAPLKNAPRIKFS